MAFTQEMAAMILRESWIAGWLAENAPDINYKIYPAPKQKEAIGGGNLFPHADLVYKYSLHKEMAWKFLEFHFTPEHDLEQNMIQGYLPRYDVNYDTEYVKSRPDYNSINEILKRGIGPAYSYHEPKMNEIAHELGDAVLNVLYGNMTPKMALDQAAERIEHILR